MATDWANAFQGGGYNSEADARGGGGGKRNLEKEFGPKSGANLSFKGAPGKDFIQRQDEEVRKMFGGRWSHMDAFTRHKKMMAEFVQFYNGDRIMQRAKEAAAARKTITDQDINREYYQFVRDPEEERGATWEQRMAISYYRKLHKEYCLADMSFYKEGKMGLRWRVDKEVMEGKGQFICGNLKCQESKGLQSHEVNFSYMERGEKKSALVKLRVCPKCAYKLNYRKIKELKREMKKKKEKRKEQKERKRRKIKAEDGEGEGERVKIEDINDDDVIEIKHEKHEKQKKEAKKKKKKDESSDSEESSSSSSGSSSDEEETEKKERAEMKKKMKQYRNGSKSVKTEATGDQFMQEMFP